MAQSINLSSTIATGLRQRCGHRLEHRRDMLNAKEIDFLHSMYELFRFSANETKHID